MKKKCYQIFILALLVLSVTPAISGELKHVTFRSKWVPQSQFAGFYVAKAKGFYKDAGLHVEIRPGGPGISSLENVAAGKDTFTVEWLMNAIALASKGAPIVNTAQIFQTTGLMLVSLKKSGIEKISQMDGKKVGVWPALFQIPPSMLMKTNNIRPKLVTQLFSMDDFINGKLDVASAMIYNEYHMVLESGIKAEELNAFHFKDYGLNFPDDGIYVNKNTIEKDPELVRSFTKASIKGWIYAINNPEETVAIVMDVIKEANTGTTEKHQQTMLQEVAKLILYKEGINNIGFLSDKTFEFIYDSLKNSKMIDKPVQFVDFYRPTYK
ncbi:MAG: ABC transporter substrate-binding protein [Desulfobacterales bacterium]|nr:ABC transporter substrate-binding protein [Desulfobacterales bacterium]